MGRLDNVTLIYDCDGMLHSTLKGIFLDKGCPKQNNRVVLSQNFFTGSHPNTCSEMHIFIFDVPFNSQYESAERKSGPP